jgi:hypothetical protein
MTTPDDFRDEMAGYYLDDGSEDSILDGTMSPDEVPAGYENVVSLVLAATAPAQPGELSREGDVVTRMVAAVRAGPAVTDASRGRLHVFRKSSLAKVVPISATLVLAGSAAAAATGSFGSHASVAAAPAAAVHFDGAAWPANRLERVDHSLRLVASVRQARPVVRLARSTSKPAPRTAGKSGDQAQAEGIVISVNGTATSGTCGTQGATGVLVLAHWGSDQAWLTGEDEHDKSVTVDVTSSTTFADPASSAPSFAEVCVGGHVHAGGTLSDGTLGATAVDVQVPEAAASGTVLSVNGASTAGTCGSAGATGSFTVSGDDFGGWGAGAFVGHDHAGGTPVTVDVTGSTTFVGPGGSAASFADVCIATRTFVIGLPSSDALDALKVFVVPANNASAAGTVTSVDGSTTAGTCGTAGGTGSFVLAGGFGNDQGGHGSIVGASWSSASSGARLGRNEGPRTVTVTVTSTTTFDDHADPSPSFADVCVGDQAAATGLLTASGIDATSVFVHGRDAGAGGGSCGGGGGSGRRGSGGSGGGGGDGRGGSGGSGGNGRDGDGDGGGGGSRGGGGGSGRGGRGSGRSAGHQPHAV